MTTILDLSPPTDADLVARSLANDRQAYRAIVERYQSLICALSYASCGSVHQSEDLAQETFLHAWRNLHQLQDRDRLKSWIVGIARNLTRNAQRRQPQHPPTHSALNADTIPAPTPAPPDEAISQEEAALLWQNLQRLPEDYREPLVLFYRRQKSVADVAAALDISEDTARQRLSRGRAMLAQRIEHLIDRGLRTTGPSAAFATAIIAALPGVALSAKAAVLAAAAKTTASAKIVALLANILGPLIGLAGGYLGYRIGLQQTIAPEERRFLKRYFLAILLLAFVFTAALLAWILAVDRLKLNPVLTVTIFVTVATAYLTLLLISCVLYSRRIRQIRAALITDPDMLRKAHAVAARWNIQYRSRWTLLGLPLIHVNIGASPYNRPAVAKGWIAIGAKAYGGLFAAGAIAIAPISFGGFSVGLVTWGGFALGIFVFGGGAAGIFAVGGLALGWKAVGGCAIAWSSAAGGGALAVDFAQGAAALAAHANDSAAEAYFAQDPFHRVCMAVLPYLNWAWIVAFAPMVPVILRALRNGKSSPADPSQPR